MSNKCACPKELKQQSVYSPDVVHDNEAILYVLLDPIQWKDGQLTYGAFSKSKLKDGSLSVSRAQYSSEDMLQERVIQPQLNRNKKRKLIGVLRALCEEIRRITGDNTPCRIFCVNDDGTENDQAHAVIAYSELTKEEGFWQKNNREAIRANLIEAFRGNPMSLADAFALP